MSMEAVRALNCLASPFPPRKSEHTLLLSRGERRCCDRASAGSKAVRKRDSRVGRCWIGCFALMLTLCPAMVPPACGQAVDLPSMEIPASRLEDAGLWDVQFLDPDQGWAVGELGVILVTRDGGDNWRPQASGTSAALRAVSFLSPRDGVVVGGWYETDTGLSRGVILRTRDGGASWEALANDLPALTAFTRLPGGVWIASGDWSSIHLGRLFVSEDQGVSWRVIDGDQTLPATALSLNAAGVTLCDHQGVLFQFDLANWQSAALSAPGPCSLLHVQGDTAIAALRSGDLLVSRDGGQRWTPLEPAPPVAAERFSAGRELPSRGGSDKANFDIGRFQALCATTSKDGTIWLAGAPGNYLLAVAPSGKTSWHPTGSNQPLRSMYFQDSFRGWAVGGLGAILTTRDGGRSWRPQRDVNKRAMVLGIASLAKHLPWSALAAESLEYGRRFAVVIDQDAVMGDQAGASATSKPLSSPLSNPLSNHNPARENQLDRARYAAGLVGGGDCLGIASGERGMAELAAAIASYKPTVLVLGADLTAERRAAIQQLAIETRIARVYQVVSSEGRGEMTFHSSAVLPVAGALTGDLWMTALEIVAPQQNIEDRLNLRLNWDDTNQQPSNAGLGSGLPARDAQWSIPTGRRRNLQVLQARSGDLKRVDRLLSQAADQEMQASQEAIELLIRQAPKETRGQLLRMLLQRAGQRGSQVSSIGAVRVYLLGLEFAASEFADEPLGRWAALRVAALQSSREWQPILALCETFTPAASRSSLTPVASHRSPFEREETELKPVAAWTVSPVDASGTGNPMFAEPIAEAFTPEPMMRQANFEQAAEQTAHNPLVAPLVALAELTGDSTGQSVDKVNAWPADAQRAVQENANGNTSGAETVLPPPELYSLATEDTLAWRVHPLVLAWKSKYGSEVMDSWDRSAWEQLGLAASAGGWQKLARPTQQSSLVAPLIPADAADAVPWLDGQLREAIWNAPAIADDQPLLRIAYDDQYIYLGIRGVFQADDRLPPAERRERDEMLVDQARVLCELDMDADLLTAYQLTIDAQGRTHDAIDGFALWQPQWYVSTDVQQGVRTIEAAISRHSLALDVIDADTRWRVRLTFLKPGEAVAADHATDPNGWITVTPE